jgi:hypothetical protein
VPSHGGRTHDLASSGDAIGPAQAHEAALIRSDPEPAFWTPPPNMISGEGRRGRSMHMSVCVTVICMQVDRLSITMDPDLGSSVRAAAARSGLSVSAWLAAAAADRLRNELLGAALDAWEAESAPFSDKELDAAARVLGLSRGSRDSAA